jgi:hypothetical protein
LEIFHVKNNDLGYILLAAMAASNNLAFAENAPTLHQVYQATQAGKLDEAQSMMDKVLQDHPNSAKAHFVEAELLAKKGLLKKAEAELNNAERLEPGLPFAKPQTVQDLKNKVATAHRVSEPLVSSLQPATSNSFPWGMLLLGIGAIAAIYFIIRAVNSRKPTAYPTNSPASIQNTSGSPLQPYGSRGVAPMAPVGGGAAPVAPASGGFGSGIMGGLATGAAVGVGMVAGEALAHRFMDGNHSGTNTAAAAPATDSWNTSSNDTGGTDFGIADNSSWDDNARIAENEDVGGDGWG